MTIDERQPSVGEIRLREERQFLDLIGPCPTAEEIAFPLVEAVMRFADLCERAETLQFGAELHDDWSAAEAKTLINNVAEAHRLARIAVRSVDPNPAAAMSAFSMLFNALKPIVDLEGIDGLDELYGRLPAAAAFRAPGCLS